MKLTKIYTRTGDNGTTSIIGGQRISKDSARLEAYGTMDELSSHLGLLAAYTDDKGIKDDITHIQCNIFNICTFLATDVSSAPIYPSARIDAIEVSELERQIDVMNEKLPELKSFVLPGGTVAAAQCHVCRTVCRRAERRIIAFYAEASHDKDDNEDETLLLAHLMLHYVNRLSDYLFVLSRNLNIIESVEEKIWKNTCR
ncbi:MAG: cob(I)yrinic acid a,c-diamide adenosyltransferase [Prevotellaceae bacterium]|nr:cob(I)yrinic acid a,c-diamide adenosyltransferase [Prevotellaceae bacterium]MDO4931131.1 cob(I)yrinic acid a,c-diamide adenosyltransferase [Prevotellaceae bacterium]